MIEHDARLHEGSLNHLGEYEPCKNAIICHLIVLLSGGVKILERPLSVQ